MRIMTSTVLHSHLVLVVKDSFNVVHPIVSAQHSKTIVYCAVVHNYVSFTNTYMFSSFMNIIGPSVKNFKIQGKMQYIYIHHLYICTYIVKIFVFHSYPIFKYCVDGLMNVVNGQRM